MERESFEDPAIADLMNRHFICVKVDREERPDLDDIYMQATLALNQGQGGWPMTVFLTPDRRPFFAGTYFPPTDRLGRPGFATLLTRIAELWQTRRDDLLAQAGQLTEYLRQATATGPGASVGEAEIRAAARELAESFDPTYGGFGPAPKFPPTAQLGLLLRHHRRTGDAEALSMVRKTLDAMAQGGMRDHIGGGFHRYSTDERWLVPHFEKMLYDNALLTRAYLEGFQATGDPAYAEVARDALDYVLREMTGPDGGFYSATDADSEGEEGKFFVWTPAEVEAVLGADAAGPFCAYYDITAEGNWEGRSIPHTPRPLARVASRLGISEAALRQSVTAGRAALSEARRRRVPPGLDDKVLTAWNGLMLSAMAEGFRALRDPRYLRAASQSADFLLGALRRPDGGLYRTWRQGHAHLDAYLEDYAFLAAGLLDLAEAGGEVRFLREAAALAERMLRDFDGGGGGFYDTASGHEDLIVRHRQGADGAIPSANAVAAGVLARLAAHLDRPAFREAAVRAIQAYGSAVAGHPRAFCTSLMVVDFLLGGPVELVLVGRAGDARLEALAADLGRRYLPNRIVAHRDPSAGPFPELPLLAGKEPVGGQAALYVCRNFTCLAPVTDAAEIERALAEPRGAAAGRTGIGLRRPGRATPEATRARAEQIRTAHPHGFGPLGSTGLTVSRLGFGGYRVDDETPEHAEALALALEAGVSLIDTSTNYTDGGSERLVGRVLGELFESGRLGRDAVVVVSKIGYVQGENLVLAEDRERAGRAFPEMVKYQDGVWHCVHPEFLADQLDRSLDRLQLETLDVCLLHNPEYFLLEAARGRRGAPEAARAEFHRRLREAFAYLESQVAAGRIGWYGVSSNTAGSPPDDPEATSLAGMLEAAEAAGGPQHHFRVVQLPLNLVESGAARTPNTGPGGRLTALGLAAERGIAVLVNRPLNAFAGGRLLRLADFPQAGPEADGLDQRLRAVAALEDEFRRQIAPGVRTEGGPPPADWFRWADQLRTLPVQLQGFEEWQQVEERMVAPAVAQMVMALNQGLSGPIGEAWAAWRDRYLAELDALLGALGAQALRRSQAQSDRVAEALAPRLPLSRLGESLSRKALWVLLGTPGVSCVLVGMRRPEYVQDALGVLAWPPPADVAAFYDAMRAERL
jgi:uncharacterized protein YyaL (SSP411 family)/aryl-alcohol dehydrogenase-like predicted oxidoreductase